MNYDDLQTNNERLENKVKDLKGRIEGYYLWMMSLPDFDGLKIRKFTEVFGDPMNKTEFWKK